MSETVDLELLRYPIGRLKLPKEKTQEQIVQWIDEITEFPASINRLTKNLPDKKLDWKYRPGGWTIRQVVHHCADSHMNAFIRFKLALTEEVPTIKTYDEDKWAELPDSKKTPVLPSISLLEGLHSRWVLLLFTMIESDFDKELYHPEKGRKLSLHSMLGLYAWHSKHHTAHIKQALEFKGRFN